MLVVTCRGVPVVVLDVHIVYLFVKKVSRSIQKKKEKTHTGPRDASRAPSVVIGYYGGGRGGRTGSLFNSKWTLVQ